MPGILNPATNDPNVVSGQSEILQQQVAQGQQSGQQVQQDNAPQQQNSPPPTVSTPMGQMSVADAQAYQQSQQVQNAPTQPTVDPRTTFVTSSGTGNGNEIPVPNMQDTQDTSIRLSGVIANLTSRMPLASSSNPAGLPPIPNSTYVPGLGLLGPDMNGFVKGVQAYQQLSQAQQNQQIQATGFNEAQFNLANQQFIQAGMQKASQEGGYPAIVNFLNNASPSTSIEFQNQKIALDNAILGNQVMQATSKQNIAAAMVNSYGLLGNMGRTIMNAPPEERQAIYNAGLPMIRAVNPNAPDNVEDAVPMFGLAASINMPKAFAYMGNAALLQSHSDIGKLEDDKAQALAVNGGDVFDPRVVALDAGIADKEAHATTAIVGIHTAQTNDAQATQTLHGTVQSQIMQIQKNTEDANAKMQDPKYEQLMNQGTKLEAGYQALMKNPNDPHAKQQIGAAWAYGLGDGSSRAVSDDTIQAMSAQDAGFKDRWNKLNSWVQGKNENISAEDAAQMYNDYNNYMNMRTTMQHIYKEAPIQQQVKDHPELYNPKGIQLPSQAWQQTQALQNQQNNTQQMLQQLPPSGQQMVQQAVKTGKYDLPTATRIAIQKYKTNPEYFK